MLLTGGFLLFAKATSCQDAGWMESAKSQSDTLKNTAMTANLTADSDIPTIPEGCSGADGPCVCAHDDKEQQGLTYAAYAVWGIAGVYFLRLCCNYTRIELAI